MTCNCTRIWSFSHLHKKSHKNNINNTSVETKQTPPQPNRRNNPTPADILKLRIWNVRSIGKDEKLLSILEGAITRYLNILVLAETGHSEKCCLELGGGHTLYNSGPTGGQKI